MAIGKLLKWCPSASKSIVFKFKKGELTESTQVFLGNGDHNQLELCIDGGNKHWAEFEA